MSPSQPIAILSALPQEQRGLREAMTQVRVQRHAGREFVCGSLCGRDVVLTLSGIGKVAAAVTTTLLVERFAVGRILFTGVAGGVGPGVRVGDVVVGTGYVQHDMDSSPLFPRFEIPLTGTTVFPADADLAAQVHQVCQEVLAAQQYQGHAVAVHQGLIASGDQFVSDAAVAGVLVEDMRAAGLEPLAVEMEGAAVAQACADYGVPFVALRSISDRADDSAPTDFVQFMNNVASVYAQAIVTSLLRTL